MCERERSARERVRESERERQKERETEQQRAHIPPRGSECPGVAFLAAAL